MPTSSSFMHSRSLWFVLSTCYFKIIALKKLCIYFFYLQRPLGGLVSHSPWRQKHQGKWTVNTRMSPAVKSGLAQNRMGDLDRGLWGLTLWQGKAQLNCLKACSCRQNQYEYCYWLPQKHSWKHLSVPTSLACLLSFVFVSLLLHFVFWSLQRIQQFGQGLCKQVWDSMPFLTGFNRNLSYNCRDNLTEHKLSDMRD